MPATPPRHLVRASIGLAALGLISMLAAASPSSAAVRRLDDLPPVSGPAVAADSGVEPAVQYLRDKYDVSESEAVRRLELQTGAAGFDQAMRLVSPETYAGTVIDQAQGAALTAFTTADDAKIAQEAAKRGLNVEVRKVERSTQQMEAVQARLTEALGRGHSEVFLEGIETAANVVSVRVDGQGPLRPDVKRALDAEGASVALARGGSNQRRGDYACTFPYCDAPLRGGVLIAGSLSSGGYTTTSQCTSGFNALQSNGTPVLMTAGHCLIPVDGALWQTRQVADGAIHSIGYGSTYYRYKDSSGDAGLIGLSNPAGWAPSNTIANWGANQTQANSNYPITSRSGSTIGAVVCLSGQTSHTKCGNVDKLDATSSTGVGGLGRASICAGEGDSGGPVFAYYTAYGLVQGGDNTNGVCETYYQGILGAESRLGVRVRTS